MKVGLIFECGPEGADQKVCQRLIAMLSTRFQREIEIVPATLGRKPDLIADCGKAAARLLETDKCDRVVIIWDLYPGYGDEPCRKQDREKIARSLEAAGVQSPDVYLVCIEKELEAWLIADERALSAFLSTPNHPVRVNAARHPEREMNPKNWLNRTFKKAGRKKRYSDLEDAEKIISLLPDFNRIRRCASFVRFAAKVADVDLT